MSVGNLEPRKRLELLRKRASALAALQRYADAGEDLARARALALELGDQYTANVVAVEQVTVLAGRAAAHVALDDPGAVAWLLDSLRRAGAVEQAIALLHRDPAAHVAVDQPAPVVRLSSSLPTSAGPSRATWTAAQREGRGSARRLAGGSLR